MRGIIFVALGAAIVGTIFFVSLFELLFTIRRRKMHAELENKIKTLRTNYNETVNQLMLEEEKKLEEVEKVAKNSTEVITGEKNALTQDYEKKIEALHEESKKALESAKKRAKKLQEEAAMKADEYLATRQKEVEKDLMELVLSVTKRVIPESLSYEIQKDLVLSALREVKKPNKKA